MAATRSGAPFSPSGDLYLLGLNTRIEYINDTFQEQILELQAKTILETGEQA